MRHKFPRTQLSAKIKSADFTISITRNALKEEMEELLSSYVHDYHVYKDLTCGDVCRCVTMCPL